MKNKLLITGATGDLGGKVVNLLKQKTEVENLSVLVRDEKNKLAKQYMNAGIDVKIGDYANLESLKKAFRGIDVLYFVSGGDDAQRSTLHKNVVDAAKEAGIRHILYTSGVRKDESELSPLATLVDSHIQTENSIKASGIAYTLLRYNLYAEVIEMLIGDKNQLLKTKTIYLPTANGLSSFVPKDDLVEAEVNILLNPTAYENKIFEFNGSEQMTFSGIAEKITGIVKEPIQYVSPEVTTFQTEISRFGLPQHIIDLLSTFSLAIAKGEFDQKSTDLEVVLGRKTKPLIDFLKEVYS